MLIHPNSKSTFSNKDYSYWTIAQKISYLSKYEIIHIGCISVYKSQIISTGYNTNKSHPIQKEYNKFRNFNKNKKILHKEHAEIMCLKYIRYLKINFSKIKLYIYRELQNGDLGNSRPCDACINFIINLGIKHIYYTSKNGFCHERLY